MLHYFINFDPQSLFEISVSNNQRHCNRLNFISKNKKFLKASCRYYARCVSFTVTFQVFQSGMQFLDQFQVMLDLQTWQLWLNVCECTIQMIEVSFLGFDFVISYYVHWLLLYAGSRKGQRDANYCQPQHPCGLGGPNGRQLPLLKPLYCLDLRSRHDASFFRAFVCSFSHPSPDLCLSFLCACVNTSIVHNAKKVLSRKEQNHIVQDKLWHH